MKLIFQIAAGIILAILIAWGAAVGYKAYSLSVAKEKVAEILKQQQMRQVQLAQQRVKQQQAERQRAEALKQAQLIQNKLAQEEQIRAIKEQALKRKKINAAWEKYYDQPYQCKYPDSQKVKIWCQNYWIKEKTEFKRLVSLGKITFEAE